MAEPSQDDVNNFRDMISIISGGSTIDEHTARRFLKDASDPQEAINEWERNPNKYTQDGYDETLFSQERDGGNAGYGAVPSFQIDNAANYPGSTVATRPNTPSNSIHDSAMGDSQTLSGSRVYQKSGLGQESGVIGGGQFGPANRPHYDADQWALTTVSNLVPDPPAPTRRREPGDPAFLKPIPSQDYLPSLITILHTIPLARAAMLLKSHLSDDYGRNPEWWQGTPISDAQVMETEDETATEQAQLEIIHETQRLVAFLDNTDRSYGSAEVLSKLPILRGVGLNSIDQYPTDTDVSKFLLAWEAAALHLEPDSIIRSMFQITATECTSDGVLKEHDFRVLKPILDHGTSGPPLSLYDVLDENLWAGDIDGVREDFQAFINEPSEIFVVTLKQPSLSATGLNMIIPSEWYVDRYLKENTDLSKQMRRARAGVRAEIKQIQERRQALSKTECDGKEVDTLKLLETAMTAFKSPKDVDDDSEEEKGEADEDTEMAGAESQTLPPVGETSSVLDDDQETLNQLQNAYDNVERKIEALKAEEDRAGKILEDFSNIFKSPANPATDGRIPTRRYRLCGFSTDPSATTYLKDWRYQIYDDEGVAMGEGDTPQGMPDWWRIHFDSTQNPPRITKNRMSEDSALAAANTENREVMLVYASDAALNHPFEPLPPVLEAFVKADNLFFLEELQRDSPPAYEEVGAAPEGMELGWQDNEAWQPDEAEDSVRQPEMEEKGAGLMPRIVGVNGAQDGGVKEKDGDVKMGDESVQHVEFADEGAQHVEFADEGLGD
ncbi:hypothetical protein K490DRAFT_57404 [Saccharata proteae CBS 121410]|uniref:Ubiquitin interaction motif protein n=1 Tax=Saccharata proteae CBS 121410 TaxID=1314787 RepID=A0A9P4HUY7_9PEZI|nr:hypothetical protein K490DRAFT_57404 [Saccharata proteae CBS 121410]